ncbi:GNAT family N-acetyltransferase [Escherichia coli]|nr:GNAT family N-acetyltransferase [Escherichia coli]
MANRARNAVKGLSVIVWCALPDFATGFTPHDGCTSGNIFLQAAGENEIAGALWLVDEGGLSQELSQAVWAGFRRPRGNLVAQSLAAHGSNPLAATLRGRRVSRIAVHPARQREGVGQQLIASALQYRPWPRLSFGEFWLHRGVMAFLATLRFCAGANG